MASSEREERLAGVVAEALRQRDECADAVDLGRLCEGDAELRADVERTLGLANRLPSIQSMGVATDPMLGRVLCERYRLDARVGSGAMGVVYRATDLELQRTVAVKLLLTSALLGNDAAARFEREAESIAAVEHASVVRVYDRRIADGSTPFLVMEFVDGVPLAELLDHASDASTSADFTSRHARVEATAEFQRCTEARGEERPVLLREAVRWVAELAGGLAAAHSAGVFHRDVKPSNAVIRRDGRAVLLDFGLARNEGRSRLTQTGAQVGTPAYMAPETLNGAEQGTVAQDVYGLAATLYHLVTLRPPYPGGPTEVLAALATREPVPAVRLHPGLPRDLQAILDVGLARDPNRRYVTAQALEADLRAFLAYRPVLARRTPHAVRVLRRLRRSRMARGFATAAVPIVCALGAVLWNHAVHVRATDRYIAAAPHVPANSGIVSAANRRVQSDAVRKQVARALDDLVEAKFDPVEAHLLRALFRFDHGDGAGAAADMQAVARSAGTPFARGVADRYRLAAASGAALEVEPLPANATDDDRYLAAVHCMRSGKYGDSVPLLAAIEPHSRRHVDELRLLTQTFGLHALSKSGDREGLHAATGAVIDASRRIEERWGFASAMTRHLSSCAYMHRGEHGLTVDLAADAAWLAPGSHVALQNAARAAMYTGDYDVAREHVLAALAIVPHYVPLYDTRTRIEAGAHCFDVARSVATGIPGEGANKALKVRLEALVDVEEARVAHHRGDAQAAQAHAGRALGLLKVLSPQHSEVRELTDVASALQASDGGAYWLALVRTQLATPLLPTRLEDIVRAMPKDPTPEQARAAMELLAAMHERLAVPMETGHLAPSESVQGSLRTFAHRPR